MKLKLKDSQTGQEFYINDTEAAKYGLDTKTVQKKVEEKKKSTAEAAVALQAEVSAALAKDPQANKRGVMYTWIKDNEPFFDELGVEAESLWAIHNKTPEVGVGQQAPAQTPTADTSGGILGRVKTAYDQTDKSATFPFSSKPPGANLMQFLKNLKQGR